MKAKYTNMVKEQMEKLSKKDYRVVIASAKSVANYFSGLNYFRLLLRGVESRTIKPREAIYGYNYSIDLVFCIDRFIPTLVNFSMKKEKSK